MTFLPIVERELGVAARQRSTFRTRTAMALLTSLLAAGLLLLQSVARSGTSSLFPVLASAGFLYCWLAGIRYAADALSEEKREGTLGLLFLTDLRGYDVVLGKLTSISIRALQGLMALLPVLSIGLLLGGLTPGEFWRSAAVLINTLFFSLSVGLCASAMSRQAHAALAGTACLLLLLTLGPYLAGLAVSKAWSTDLHFLLGLSPASAAFAAADMSYRARPLEFWEILGLNHLCAWCSLLLASFVLPRSWRERGDGLPPRSAEVPIPTDVAPSPAAAGYRVRLRAKLLDINPVYWLAARNQRELGWSWVFVGVIVVGGASQVFLTRITGGYTLGMPGLFNFGIGLMLKLWVAWHASVTLAEARRTGAIELILATPVTVADIIRGQWQALRRVFLGPVLAMLLLDLLPLAQPLLSPGTTAGGPWFLPPVVTLFSMATFVTDLASVAFVGMWMGLRQRGPVRAFSRTVVYTMVVPTVFFCCPNIVFDLFWIAWAHHNLETQFRRTATELYAPVAPPTFVPALASTLPPVIPKG